MIEPEISPAIPCEMEFSSFRDPSGMVYYKDDQIFRKINPIYFPHYQQLMESGLYKQLTGKGYLVEHQEISCSENEIVIQPFRLPFISYPYEWSFGQLKDAALLTLKIHRTALDYDMILKDASAYNVQFDCGKPTLIDTLSFEKYHDNQPWGAYGQFCRHFLAPLLLMSSVDIRLNRLLTLYMDGCPLDLASKMLKGKGGFFALQHIHWHSKMSVSHAQDGKSATKPRQATLSLAMQKTLVDSLIRGIDVIRLKNVQTEWGDYYSRTNYTDSATSTKEKIVADFMAEARPKMVWDIGANDGTYSKIALTYAELAVAFDIDPIAVERNYQEIKKHPSDMLPLLLDLTNPSPAIGFANLERLNLALRPHPDMIMMLAVIHHMAISNNLPFQKIAEWVAGLCTYLIIEFVPKSDSQVSVLLSTRTDIFPHYTLGHFEEDFGRFFEIVKKELVTDSQRTMYLLKNRKA